MHKNLLSDLEQLFQGLWLSTILYLIKKNPQWELEYIQINRRLEAVRNQIDKSENILLSLNSVRLEFIFNHMPIGYQKSKEPQHVLLARFLEVIGEISNHQSIFFHNQNTSAMNKFNINMDCCDEYDFDSDDAMFTDNNGIQFIPLNAYTKADILFFLHQIGLYSMFDAGYQDKELYRDNREYPGLANLHFYNKIPNMSHNTYNHCPLCKTYSLFWRKFGIREIIKKQ